MTQYIDKSALVAEIEKLMDELYSLLPNASKVENGTITISEACNTGKYTALESFRNYIDTLEVKESLTWQDIRLISEIGEKFMNSEESDNLSEEEYYTEILNRFKAQKHETNII